MNSPRKLTYSFVKYNNMNSRKRLYERQASVCSFHSFNRVNSINVDCNRERRRGRMDHRKIEKVVKGHCIRMANLRFLMTRGQINKKK